MRKENARRKIPLKISRNRYSQYEYQNIFNEIFGNVV